MGKIKALLVGVCEYPATCSDPLPLCKSDLYAVKSALIDGLNVNPKDICLCGELGTVTSIQLLETMAKLLSTATSEDMFVFYFSGHGGRNCLVLSDGLIPLQELIDLIEKTVTKSKIIILDSCHSGGFAVNGTAQMDLTETIESFAGRGYAVLASCGADQYSGFHKERQISLYTSFLCDALTNRFLIRHGQKSLEAINEAIFQYAAAWNRKGIGTIQQPIVRSNIGGTIFFDVEEYNPYKVAQIYEETDKYIIYSVEPSHHCLAKRLAIYVILRYESSMEQIADIASEIKEKVLYYEVHQNKIAEDMYKGKPANIVWCYFGYDEDDMIDRNFFCHTIWVDDLQDKNWWYRKSENSMTVNNVYIDIHTSYEIIKSLYHSENIDKDGLILQTRKYTSELISVGERYIKLYREYRNNTISEEQLIEAVASLNETISILYSKQSKLPVPPKELHDWANVHRQISCTIHDFSLYYSKQHLGTWPSKNRMFLMNTSIKRYETELELLKKIDRTI